MYERSKQVFRFLRIEALTSLVRIYVYRCSRTLAGVSDYHLFVAAIIRVVFCPAISA